jgi:MFS family permease
MVLIGAGVLGASIGNLLMSLPLWLAEAFPGPVYPRLFALANMLSVMGVAMGPFMLGLAYDYADYTLAYGAALLASLVALLFIAAAGANPHLQTEPV